ncbi:MAG TPA: protein kinase [Vicinamibacterales bacterium]|nr:protein kinase [Vicinamibacterales bacterium]
MNEAPSIVPGARLGPYEIVSLLDAGGMGVVYRARDPRLGRNVAIKVLPESAVADDTRLRRFEAEARAAGALDHPNVLVVYDIGHQAGVPFIVSELLDGQTLRARLVETGAVPQRKALEWTQQIAQGLAAAHAKGIVHRDLKPENLFLTRDGRVKILDFGISKLVHVDGDERADPTQPTMTAAQLTGTGMLLGTVGYMAPEQVRGQPVDPRTDIFALGVVVCEMLTGAAPFRRETSAETLTAILKDDPPGLPPAVPTAVDRVIRRCLEKRPEDRFYSAHDLSLALEALSAATGSIAGVPLEQPASRMSRRLLLVGGGMGLLAAGLAGGSFLGGRAQPAATPTYHRLTFRRGMIRTARFGPDYRTILYGALWDGDDCRIHTVRDESPESAPLNLPPATPLAVSSLGELALALGTHSRGIMTYGTLARVPLAGGAPRELLEDVKYADWSPDGQELAVIRRVGGRERLEFPIGNVVAEPESPGGGFSFLRMSPQGDRVAVFALTFAGGLTGNVAVVDRAGNRRIVSRQYFNCFGLSWKGDEIWFSAADERPLFRNTIHAITQDGAARVVVRTAGNVSLHDVAPDGRVLISHTNDRSGISVMAPGAAAEQDISWLDASSLGDLSRDGRLLLFTENGVGGGPRSSIYIRSTDGAPAVRLGDGFAWALSPDAKWAVASSAPGSSRVLDLLPVGPGEVRRIERPGVTFLQTRWLPHGFRLVVRASEQDRSARLYTLDLDAGTFDAITPEGVAIGSIWAVSPDGTSVVVASDRGVEVYPLGPGQPRMVPGLPASDLLLAWIDDGLLVSDGPNPTALSEVFLVNPVTGARRLWREIVPPDAAGIMNVFALMVTPDGRSYAYSWHRALSDLFLVEGLI